MRKFLLATAAVLSVSSTAALAAEHNMTPRDLTPVPNQTGSYVAPIVRQDGSLGGAVGGYAGRDNNFGGYVQQDSRGNTSVGGSVGFSY